MIDITSLVHKEVTASGMNDGVCMVYVPHTTAGITINEGADPSVCDDIIMKLNKSKESEHVIELQFMLLVKNNNKSETTPIYITHIEPPPPQADSSV